MRKSTLAKTTNLRKILFTSNGPYELLNDGNMRKIEVQILMDDYNIIRDIEILNEGPIVQDALT